MSKLTPNQSRRYFQLEIDAERKYHYILGQLNINESFKNPDDIRKLSHAGNWINGFLATNAGGCLAEFGLSDVENIARRYEDYLHDKKTIGIDFDDIENFIAWKIWEEKLATNDGICWEPAKRSALMWKMSRNMRTMAMESIGRHARTTIKNCIEEVLQKFPASDATRAISAAIPKMVDEIAEGLRKSFGPDNQSLLAPLFESLGFLEPNSDVKKINGGNNQ